MKVSQYEKYRAVYCGLCRSMGRVTGQISRLTLSYDFVFLASVRMILCGVNPQFETSVCAAHPLRKRLIVKDNDALEFTSAVAATLAWAKNKDDLADEHGAAKIKPILVNPLVGYISRRGKKYLPDNAAEETLKCLTVLAELESAGCTSADEAADAFGETLGYFFSLDLDEDRSCIAREIGYSVGKFIYMCDAADDMEDDIRKGRYNPLYLGWGELALDKESGKMSSLVRESVMTSAPIELERLGEAVERISDIAPDHEMLPIVRNTVYLGLPHAMRRILYREEDMTNEKNPGTGKI